MIKIKKNIDFLVITGPTAVGKSDLAIKIAQENNGEIINADSVQVYKKLNIGSAKIKQEEMKDIKHHLISYIEPHQSYDVYQFMQDANNKILEIKANNKLPIFVGGTGLYLDSIVYEYSLEKEELDLELKTELNKLSNQELFDIIKHKCQQLKKDIHINNRQRNLRYAYKIKKGISLEDNNKTMKNCQVIVLDDNREDLYNKINQRVDNMIELGLIDEVKQFQRDWHSQQSIGYKEVHQYINQEISKLEMIDLIKKNTRNLAKKQWTWFRKKYKNCEWYKKKGEEWQLIKN